MVRHLPHSNEFKDHVGKNIPIQLIRHFLPLKKSTTLYNYLNLFQLENGGYIDQKDAYRFLRTKVKDSRTVKKHIQDLLDEGLITSEFNNKVYKLLAVYKAALVFCSARTTQISLPSYKITEEDLSSQAKFMEWCILADTAVTLKEHTTASFLKTRELRAKGVTVTKWNDLSIYRNSQGNKTGIKYTSTTGFYTDRSQGIRLGMDHSYVWKIRKKLVQQGKLTRKATWDDKFETYKIRTMEDCMAFANAQDNPYDFHAKRFVSRKYDNDGYYYSLRMEDFLEVEQPSGSTLLPRKVRKEIIEFNKQSRAFDLNRGGKKLPASLRYTESLLKEFSGSFCSVKSICTMIDSNPRLEASISKLNTEKLKTTTTNHIDDFVDPGLSQAFLEESERLKKIWLDAVTRNDPQAKQLGVEFHKYYAIGMKEHDNKIKSNYFRVHVSPYLDTDSFQTRVEHFEYLCSKLLSKRQSQRKRRKIRRNSKITTKSSFTRKVSDR